MAIFDPEDDDTNTMAAPRAVTKHVAHTLAAPPPAVGEMAKPSLSTERRADGPFADGTYASTRGDYLLVKGGVIVRIRRDGTRIRSYFNTARNAADLQGFTAASVEDKLVAAMEPVIAESLAVATG